MKYSPLLLLLFLTPNSIATVKENNLYSRIECRSSGNLAGLWVGTYTVNGSQQRELFYSFIVFPDGSITTKSKGANSEDFFYAEGKWELSSDGLFSATISTITSPAGEIPVRQKITAIYSEDGSFSEAKWNDESNLNGSGNSGQFPFMRKVSHDNSLTGFNKEKSKKDLNDPEEMLINTTWQIEELRFLQNNTAYYYNRGQTGNVAGLDIESITFNSDHTGIYIAGDNKYTLSWEFSNEEKTELQYLLNESTPLLITWENLRFEGNQLEYTEYYNRDGMESLARGRRVSTKNEEIITLR